MEEDFKFIIKFFIYQDAERGEFQCHQNHNEWEDYLETWWKMVICLPLNQYLLSSTYKNSCQIDSFNLKGLI